MPTSGTVELLSRFGAGKSFTDHEADAMPRSAVERQSGIIGEALDQLRKVDAALASAIPDVNRIVAFRNTLIHGYAPVDDALVWQALIDEVPALDQVLRRLLDRADD